VPHKVDRIAALAVYLGPITPITLRAFPELPVDGDVDERRALADRAGRDERFSAQAFPRPGVWCLDRFSEREIVVPGYVLKPAGFRDNELSGGFAEGATGQQRSTYGEVSDRTLERAAGDVPE
jgi:hypothetical protein